MTHGDQPRAATRARKLPGSTHHAADSATASCTHRCRAQAGCRKADPAAWAKAHRCPLCSRAFETSVRVGRLVVGVSFVSASLTTSRGALA